MAVTTLLGALAARFLADADLVAAAPGSPYVGQEPENTALPFCIIDHGGEVPDETFESLYHDDCSFSIIVWAKGAAAAESLASQVKRVFDELIKDPNLLTFPGAKCVQFQRLGYAVKPEEQRASDGELVYNVVMPFACKLRRTR